MSRRALFLDALGITTEWLPRRAAPPTAARADSAWAEEAAEAAEAGVAPAVAAATDAAHVAPGAVPAWVAAPVAPRGNAGETDGNQDDAEAGAAAPIVLRSGVPERGDNWSTPPAQVVEDLDWAALQTRVSGCTACRLCETRTQTVFGVGDPQAEWMLIGEAPGENEDLQGEPFVGQAGKLLDNMLAALGMARGHNVFIANVLKCRPPGNRNPEPDEVAACEPYLRRQIALIQPKLIVVLGRFAAQSLLRTTTPIGKLRGTVHRYEGIPVVVTYHPAYLLRSLTDKARAWEDLCLARTLYREAGGTRLPALGAQPRPGGPAGHRDAGAAH